MNHENKEYKPEIDQMHNSIEDPELTSSGNEDEGKISIDELRDVKAALLRAHTRTPDVEDEWKRVVTRAKAKEQPRAEKAARSSCARPFWWVIGGMSAGVAATLAILLSIGFFTQNQSANLDLELPVVLYSAVDMPGEVSILAPEVEEETSIPIAKTKEVSDAMVYSNLSNAELKSLVKTGEDAIEVLDMRNVKGSDMEERIITTPIGKNLRIILADNTQVLLNSESSLRVPLRFSGEKRTVYLEGEAYFNVAPDKAHPFNVVSQNICTTALGTEFDVKAYQRADIKVALLQGSVRVENLTDSASVILTPGQDATSVGGKLVVAETDLKALVHWKQGFFYFDNVPLVDMMVELGRWYNVNVELNHRSLMSYRMHFVAGRNEDVNDIVSRINRLGHFSADFDGHTLKIKEKDN